MNLAFYSLFFLGQVSFLTFFYLFPSGRFVPRWTRWCAFLYAVYWVAWLSFLGGLASGAPGGLFLLFLLTAVIAQVYRYRSVSTRAERQQTIWVVFGFALAILLFIFTRLIFLLLPSDLNNSRMWNGLVGGGSVYLAFMLIPIFIGIAIFRAQLFDIDLVIKRTLVYGLLTAFVIGIYVLVSWSATWELYFTRMEIWSSHSSLQVSWLCFFNPCVVFCSVVSIAFCMACAMNRMLYWPDSVNA